MENKKYKIRIKAEKWAELQESKGCKERKVVIWVNEKGLEAFDKAMRAAATELFEK